MNILVLGFLWTFEMELLGPRVLFCSLMKKSINLFLR
jgi:hypothetical protein